MAGIGVGGGDEVVDVMFPSIGLVISARQAACSCQWPRYHAVGGHEEVEVARQDV